MGDRDWTVYWNEDGEPWAIFLDGHEHDLRTLRSVTCKEEIRLACCRHLDDDHELFNGIGRWWIIDLGDDADDNGHPWAFCEKGVPGARPITGARFE